MNSKEFIIGKFPAAYCKHENNGWFYIFAIFPIRFEYYNLILGIGVTEEDSWNAAKEKYLQKLIEKLEK